MNNIDELRNQLFTTLAALNNKDQPMEIERAKAIAEISQTIINSAKVEVEYLKVAGGTGTGFMSAPGTTRRIS